MRSVTLVKIGEKYAVKFKSGLFSRWNYIDMVNDKYTWRKEDKHFKDCLTSLEMADKVYSRYIEETIIKTDR